MSITKTLLSYDSADLANSDQVGAHLLVGSTEITATGTALDVNITNAIAVDLDGIYSLSNLTPDNVGVIAHSRAATPGASDQIERTTAGGLADAIVNANVHSLDVTSFLMGYNGTTWDRVQVGSGGSLKTDFSANLIADDAVDAGGSLKVGTRAVSTLSALSAAGDRGDMISDVYRRLYVNNQPNRAGALLAPTVSATASQADATALAGRKRILIQNLSDKDIFLGTDNAVTSSTGIKIAKQANLEIEWGENIQIWLISAGSISSDVRILEIA